MALGKAALEALGMGDKEKPDDVDPHDHPALAHKAVQELEKEGPVEEGDPIAAKQEQARTLESTYTPMLEPGIVMTIQFETRDPAQPDAGVVFHVTIAPNTTKEDGRVRPPGTSGEHPEIKRQVERDIQQMGNRGVLKIDERAVQRLADAFMLEIVKSHEAQGHGDHLPTGQFLTATVFNWLRDHHADLFDTEHPDYEEYVQGSTQMAGSKNRPRTTQEDIRDRDEIPPPRPKHERRTRKQRERDEDDEGDDD
jgi:hypothetical protein